MSNNGQRVDPISLPPEKMAPPRVEAAEALLGSILINPASLFDVMDFLKPDDFFITRNDWVYQALLRINARGEKMDYLLVVEELKAQNRLDEIGGAAYVTYLINHTPSSIYAEAYGRIVERAAIRRRLLNAASEVAQIAHAEEMDIHEVVRRAETAVLDVTTLRHERRGAMLGTILDDVVGEIERRSQAGEKITGVPSGFTDLDVMLGGFQKSDLILIAARPGMGKTSWLLSAALNAARRKARVGIFTVEMTKKQMVQRLISAESGISSETLRNGQLTDREWALFTEAQNRLHRLPIHIDDTPAITPIDLRSKARRLVHEMGLDLIMVDYIGLMHSDISSHQNNRVQEVSYISWQLKQLARELNVPVIAASQLSRALEQRKDKRPILSDLRDSGSLEQDADVVLFIYRDEAYNDNTERPNQADLIIAKHRSGPTGSVGLYFRKELTQFTDLRRTEIDLVGY